MKPLFATALLHKWNSARHDPSHSDTFRPAQLAEPVQQGRPYMQLHHLPVKGARHDPLA